jgi:hypothetical protein
MLPHISTFKIPRAELLAREEVQASIVNLWVQGYSQKEIARSFGFAKSPPINQIIMRFCVKYAPEKAKPRYSYDPNLVFPAVWGDQRRMLAQLCLARYRNRTKAAVAQSAEQRLGKA